MTGRPLICLHCEQPFQRKANIGAIPDYCSPECKHNARKAREDEKRDARLANRSKPGPRRGTDSARKKRPEDLRRKDNPSRYPAESVQTLTDQQAPARDYCAIAERWASDAVAGRIVQCKWIQLAAARHLRDLQRQSADAFPYRFNAERANKFCAKLERYPHIKGRWAARGATLTLEPWQCFAVAVPFGWERLSNGTRRFREMYMRVPRKNAKSTLAAGIGLNLAFTEEEFGAEVYSGATTEKQAWEVFGPARLMLDRSGKLAQEYGAEVWAKALIRPEDNSRFLPIIGKPGDGASPSCAIVDEFHEHDTPDQYDAMKTGMGAREQPMMVIITTAGDDLASPCKEKDDQACEVLEGKKTDEELFAMIFTIDDSDDWTSPAALDKANPNIGVSVDRDYLLAQQRNAIQNPANQNTFKTKHLNLWVGAAVAAINSEDWRRASDPSMKREAFKGARAVKALDLASKIDICADVDVFVKMVNGMRHYYALGRYYIPAETVMSTEVNKQAYSKWVAEGHLIQTPGAEIDFSTIRESVKADRSFHQIEEIRYDPWRATQLAQEMESDGARTVEMPQGAQLMASAFDEFLTALRSGRFHHDGNPVLEWMAGNTMAVPGPKGVLLPGKEKKKLHKKIDGIVAVVMGIAGAMSMPVASDNSGMMGWLRNPVAV